MTEQERYEAVAAQIKQLLDLAAHDEQGIASLGRVWLAAEMYMKNEQGQEKRVKQEHACKPI
jgi:hypothetical protein